MFGMTYDVIKTSKKRDFEKLLSIFKKEQNRTFKNEKKEGIESNTMDRAESKLYIAQQKNV